MTYASAAKPLLARFETYLAGAFHPVPQERVIAGAIQSFYGWFFAFLRNAFICGVLQYLADASGSIALQVFAIIAYIVQRTSIGRALRATAENRDVARLLGVSGSRITLIAFMMSGALAGAAGVLIALHYAVITPYVGVEIGLKAIAVMVIGGTSRIWGALIAGPLIGIAEVLTVAYGGSQIRDFVVYGFMILILLFRPQGLLGGGGADQGQRV